MGLAGKHLVAEPAPMRPRTAARGNVGSNLTMGSPPVGGNKVRNEILRHMEEFKYLGALFIVTSCAS